MIGDDAEDWNARHREIAVRAYRRMLMNFAEGMGVCFSANEVQSICLVDSAISTAVQSFDDDREKKGDD